MDTVLRLHKLDTLIQCMMIGLDISSSVRSVGTAPFFLVLFACKCCLNEPGEVCVCVIFMGFI